MRRSSTARALYIILALLVALPVPATSQVTEKRIDLDGNPVNGAESKVVTRVISSFPVQVENTIFNNAGGSAYSFIWQGAGPGGFNSFITAGPGVGTRWIWSSTQTVYSIESPIAFTPMQSVPVFGQHPVVPIVGGNDGVFIVPGKSILPTQVTLSNASLESSLVTFFSPAQTQARCGVNCVQGQCDLFVENLTGETATIRGEQQACCLEPQQIICAGECYSYLEDTANCGGCGIACGAGEICSNGECMCPEGQTQCGDGCFDLTADVANCGDCDTACVAEQSCVEGGCLCPEGESVCGEACVATGSDPLNCGECGVACAAEQSCVNGSCSCPGGETLCGGECVDLYDDPDNCGSCDFECGEDLACDNSTCFCPLEGQTDCSGTCTYLTEDADNCGACGNACGEDQFCYSGQCFCLDEGSTDCGGACVNTSSDAGNCGGCGTVCAEGQTCVAGSCVCAEGEGFCGGSCIDLQADEANCGSCGNACEEPQVCAAGSCGCPGGLGLCGYGCFDLQTDPDNCGSCGSACEEGWTCVAGSCSCPEGETSCGEACVDLQTDFNDCGTCGTSCVAGQTCVAGSCVCGEGEGFCGGSCIDVQSDEANCGSCGNVCGDGKECAGGSCACTGGFASCGEDCVDLQTDAANCGGCGAACGAGQACTGGSCACTGDLTLCGGECVDLYGDPDNCGSCGNECAEGLGCDNFTCFCPSEGQTQCGETCTYTSIDEANCGACGNACLEGEMCEGGYCCSGGQVSCGEGCVDLNTDVSNCGECGQACGEGQACVGGACACIEGDLCSGTCVDLQTDEVNCGTCGNVCEEYYEECIEGFCEDVGGSATQSKPRTFASVARRLKPAPPAPADGTGSPRTSEPERSAAPANQTPAGKTATTATPSAPMAKKAGPAAVPGAKESRTPPAAAARVTRGGDGKPERVAPGSRSQRSAPAPDAAAPETEMNAPSTAASLSVEEAPVCDIQPFEQVVPNGGRFVLNQPAARYGKEVYTTVTVESHGNILAQGPCPVIVPVVGANTTGVVLSPVKVATVDSSGDGLCQPDEVCNYYISLNNVGDTACTNPIATLSSDPDEANTNEVTFINDRSAYQTLPAWPGAGQPVQSKTNLLAFSVATPEEQGANVGRRFQLSVDCGNLAQNIETPVVIGIGGTCDPATDLDGEHYDVVDGFRWPIDTQLVLQGGPINTAPFPFYRPWTIPLDIRIGCGGLSLNENQIEPNPEIIALVHSTLGPVSVNLIKGDHPWDNPQHPRFRCDAWGLNFGDDLTSPGEGVPTLPDEGTEPGDFYSGGEVLGDGGSDYNFLVPVCRYAMHTSRLAKGNYVMSVRMPDGRVFQAGFTIK